MFGVRHKLNVTVRCVFCGVLQGSLRREGVCPVKKRSFTLVMSAAPAMPASTARSQVRYFRLMPVPVFQNKMLLTRSWQQTSLQYNTFCLAYVVDVLVFLADFFAFFQLHTDLTQLINNNKEPEAEQKNWQCRKVRPV